MAKDRATAPRGKADSKAKAAKTKAPRGAQLKQMVQVFKFARERDRALPLWMLLTFIAAAAVVFLLTVLAGVALFVGIPLAVLVGVLAAMIIFSRRVQKLQYGLVEGQPGAAGAVVQNIRGWRVTQGVQVTGQLDVVHRALGRPGVVLIGEGQPNRVKPLIAQEKKRVARIAGDTPIYDVTVGDEDGQVSIRKLNRYLVKLPRNLTQAQVTTLEKRMAALGGTKAAPVPKGPMPARARPSGMERTLRRR
jgi:hypothetical protein